MFGRSIMQSMYILKRVYYAPNKTVPKRFDFDLTVRLNVCFIICHYFSFMSLVMFGYIVNLYYVHTEKGIKKLCLSARNMIICFKRNTLQNFKSGSNSEKSLYDTAMHLASTLMSLT